MNKIPHTHSTQSIDNFKKTSDVSGRDRFTTNLLHSWGGYIIIIVAGFIMPRLMDRHLGQASLGIWDFAWSFVSYLSMARLDIGSGINRYVAKYRAEDNQEKLSTLLSTVLILQLATAAIVLIGTSIVIYFLPILITGQHEGQIETARWVVGLLGLSLAIRMANGSSSGIMTGCHRWDTHNTITVTSRIVEVGIMWIFLSQGMGLIVLAVIIFFVAVGTELQRLRLSRKICPGVDIRLSRFSWSSAGDLFRFGIKTFIFDFPPLFLVQTTNLLIASQLGPAQLAVFARSVALVRHVETFSNKFASILSPMAGSLQSMGDKEELRQFFLNKSRFGVAFATPLLVFLFINGDVVLSLWMGEGYALGTPLAILAAGYLLPTAQNSIREILKGLNMHGRIGIATTSISLFFFTIGFLLVNIFSWSLTSAALLIAVPLGASLGFIPSYYACRRLDVSYLKYCRHTLFVPFLANTIFGGCLFLGRHLFPSEIFLGILLSTLVGSFALLTIYFKFIIPNLFEKISYFK